MNFEISKQLSATDRKQVLHLLAESFPVEYTQGLSFFGFFIDNHPEQVYLLGRDETGEIIGIICLLNRQMYYHGLTLAVTGCSYMAVKKDHRDFSVSATLREQMFAYQSEHSDVSIGFARRVMDNYWYAFGFTGFTNFGKLSVELHRLPSATKLSISDMEETDMPAITALYDLIYRNQLNSLIRTGDVWSYICKKIKRENKKIRIIKTIEGSIVGYVYYSDNVVEEFCLEEPFMLNAIGLLRNVVEQEMPEAKELILQIGITHPFARLIRTRFEHSVHTRFAWKGGHIIRINKLADFFGKIKPVLQARLLAAGLRSFDYTIHEISFLFDGKNLQIEVPSLNMDIENRYRHFWHKLIFGVQDIEEIIEKVQHDSGMLMVFRIMFPVTAPQVPLLDQF